MKNFFFDFFSKFQIADQNKISLSHKFSNGFTIVVTRFTNFSTILDGVLESFLYCDSGLVQVYLKILLRKYDDVQCFQTVASEKFCLVHIKAQYDEKY